MAGLCLLAILGKSLNLQNTYSSLTSCQIQSQAWNVPIAKATTTAMSFIGFAYQGKDIVFRFIIEYNSLRDFGPK